MSQGSSLIGLIAPQPNSTIMVYDVHANESGALAILDDLYKQIYEYEDRTVKWIFIVSTPDYQEADNIIVRRFPWVKKNWGYRYYFEVVTTRAFIREYQPTAIISMQNKGISFYNNKQIVYLHLAFILSEYKFHIKSDGIRLWLYQNIVSKSIFRSLQKVDLTVVQTVWMKEALIRKGGVKKERIVVQQPDISVNHIREYVDNSENRKRFFYPATAFAYKNHMTLLKALEYAETKGLKEYEVIFTIDANENKYTQLLYRYAAQHKLNVNFGGMIPRDQVFIMYSKSILIFPSYVESFGLPLLEARLSGTFIITSDCPFSKEILQGYDQARYFSKMDYKELGDHLLNIVI